MLMTETSGPARGAPARREAPPRYDAASRAFHWVTVALILMAAALGLWIAHARPEDQGFKLALYNIHESIGATIWAVTLARLAWRLGHPPPPLPADLPNALKLAARLNHAAFYVWLLTMPVVCCVATKVCGF